MYKITNLKFRVCIVIHETRNTKHEDFVYRLVNSSAHLYTQEYGSSNWSNYDRYCTTVPHMVLRYLAIHHIEGKHTVFNFKFITESSLKIKLLNMSSVSMLMNKYYFILILCYFNGLIIIFL